VGTLADTLRECAVLTVHTGTGRSRQVLHLNTVLALREATAVPKVYKSPHCITALTCNRNLRTPSPGAVKASRCPNSGLASSQRAHKHACGP
jgi:hypothetical protein